MNAWTELAYPLSVQELTNLHWLREKIEAVCFLDERAQAVDFMFARRLVFARWLATTGRLNEGMGA